MDSISRRDAGDLAILGAAALLVGGGRLFGAARIDSVVRGVQIGAQSYSFRDRDLAAAIKAYQTVGLGECELWQGHVEPKHLSREALRKWRLTVPLSRFRAIRRHFDNAGILLYAYNYSFRSDFTDPEIERGFQMTQAMGLKYITASSNVSVAPRVDKYAQKYKITVGFHNHDDTANPDEFSTPATFERALKGASKYLAINLDIGHFTAANQDPVSFIKQHHGRIVTLHIKDRKRNHGPAVPFGQGDTPIVAVLRLLRDNHWKIPANIEYEYGPKPGLDTIAEMKKCYAYMREALVTNGSKSPAPVKV
ncbi:MAG TPA: sugar phosphate isomerase/epimerase [Terriglobia bacterium]|nr:sugar phosphate isomerase/epimerase [Terriglobia bacterium]